MAIILLVARSLGRTRSVCGPKDDQQKTPTSSSARTKGRIVRNAISATYGLPRYHLEYAGSLPFRRAFLPDGRNVYQRCAESGLRYNGLSRTDLLAEAKCWAFFSHCSRGRPSALRRWRDSQPRDRYLHLSASGSRDPALWAALWARTPPIEAGWRRPTIADTIASDGEICQGANGGQRPFHVKRAGFPLDSPYPCWYDRRNELLADHKNWRGGYPRQ